jgi:predicted CoA-binding protein
MADNRICVVVGNTADTNKYWYRIFRDIKKYGLKVYCVNPAISEAEGNKIYPDFKSLPEQGTDLILVARPEISAVFVNEASNLNYKDIWFQPGTYSEEAASKAQNAGIEVHDECFMISNNIW